MHVGGLRLADAQLLHHGDGHLDGDHHVAFSCGDRERELVAALRDRTAVVGERLDVAQALARGRERHLERPVLLRPHKRRVTQVLRRHGGFGAIVLQERDRHLVRMSHLELLRHLVAGVVLVVIIVLTRRRGWIFRLNLLAGLRGKGRRVDLQVASLVHGTRSRHRQPELERDGLDDGIDRGPVSTAAQVFDTVDGGDELLPIGRDAEGNLVRGTRPHDRSLGLEIAGGHGVGAIILDELHRHSVLLALHQQKAIGGLNSIAIFLARLLGIGRSIRARVERLDGLDQRLHVGIDPHLRNHVVARRLLGCGDRRLQRLVGFGGLGTLLDLLRSSDGVVQIGLDDALLNLRSGRTVGRGVIRVERGVRAMVHRAPHAVRSVGEAQLDLAADGRHPFGGEHVIGTVGAVCASSLHAAHRQAFEVVRITRSNRDDHRVRSVLGLRDDGVLAQHVASHRTTQIERHGIRDTSYKGVVVTRLRFGSGFRLGIGGGQAVSADGNAATHFPLHRPHIDEHGHFRHVGKLRSGKRIGLSTVSSNARLLIVANFHPLHKAAHLARSSESDVPTRSIENSGNVRAESTLQHIFASLVKPR